MAVTVRDPGPMARLEDVKRDVTAPSEVFQRLTEGARLEEIAKAWAVPKGRFVEWFTVHHADLYDAALKVRAADLALDAMQAALDATPEDVAVKKLQADVALKLASKWDRLRYGETVRVERSVAPGADAGLIGTMGALLALVASGGKVQGALSEKVIEQVPEAVRLGTPGRNASDVADAELLPAVRTPARAAEELLI